MRALLLLATAALFSAPAHAGGLGVLGTVGSYSERVYFYSKADPDSFNADEPVLYDSPLDYERFQVNQIIPTMGGGLELLLGDRDDLINGSFRGYYQMEAPQRDPALITETVPSDYVVAAYREKARHVGIGLIGLNWGITEFASDRVRIGVAAHVGTGFITVDHTEFFIGSIGPSLAYKASRRVHVFGDVVYQARARQVLNHSANVALGVRYHFD